MPWMVSMRMTGQLNGARPMVRTRRSVICRADGLELVLVFCGRASRVSLAQKPADSAAAVVLRKLRRGFKGLTSIQNNTAGPEACVTRTLSARLEAWRART